MFGSQAMSGQLTAAQIGKMVDRQGTPRITDAGEGGRKVAAFPMPLYTPKGSDKS